MDELSIEHIEWLRAQNDRSGNTIKSRIRVLKSVGNAGTATRDDLDQWWQSRTHLADGTRAVDLSHLREFYKWCMMYDHLEKDPSIRLRTPRLENVIYDDKVSDEELSALLDKLPDDLGRAVLLGAGAGLRVAESAALDWENVDSKNDMIKVVRSKGKKTRMVPVAPQLIARLAQGHPGRYGNVVTAGEKPYSAPQLQRKLNRAMRAAGAEFTTHDLRHRFGISAYRSNPDILAVGEMMGHENTNTTKLYASADSEAKRRIASAVMWF